MFDETTLAERESDAAILALWREWRAAFFAPRSGDDEELNAVVEACIALERRLYDLPAQGPVALAIKIWMLAFEIRGMQSGNQLYGFQYQSDEDYRPDGRMWPDALLLKRLIEDAVRIVPELALLSEPILDAPMIIDPQLARQARSRLDIVT